MALKLEELDTYNLHKFTESALNGSLALRKLKKINIYEKDTVFNPRPQMNILLVKQFGTNKSSTLKLMSNILKEDYISRDDFTKPSFLGTIDRFGGYIQGIVSICGGKVLCIDEWNNLSSDTRDSMLTTMENQYVSRSLGFKVKEKIEIKDDFTNIIIEGGKIEGKCQFSCIAMAMSITQYSGVKDRALMSRFRLIQHFNTKVEMKKINGGDLNYELNDYSQNVDIVNISKDAWKEFVYKFHEDLDSKGLYPFKDDYGNVNRTSIDILHDTIYLRFKREKCDKEITIDNADELIQNIPYGEMQLRMYAHKEQNTFDKFVEIISSYPNKGYKWYCSQLDINKSQFYNLVKKYERIGDKKISLIEKMDDEGL